MNILRHPMLYLVLGTLLFAPLVAISWDPTPSPRDHKIIIPLALGVVGVNGLGLRILRKMRRSGAPSSDRYARWYRVVFKTELWIALVVAMFIGGFAALFR